MREEVLAHFFMGTATSSQLANDLNGAEQTISGGEIEVNIQDMQDGFVVTREMAVRVCDAILRDELEPTKLSTIGFALIASDKFMWDGDDVLGDVISDWSCPEINYPLTLANVQRFRAWLTGAEEYPEKTSRTEYNGRLIYTRRKKSFPEVGLARREERWATARSVHTPPKRRRNFQTSGRPGTE